MTDGPDDAMVNDANLGLVARETAEEWWAGRIDGEQAMKQIYAVALASPRTDQTKEDA